MPDLELKDKPKLTKNGTVRKYAVPTTVDEREAVKALLIAGKSAQEAAKITGYPLWKVHNWQTEYGWRKLVRSVRTISTTVQSQGEQAVTDAGLQTKRALSRELARMAEALSEAPAPDLTIPTIRNRMSVCKPMIEAAKALHGWGTSEAGSVTTVSIDELTMFSGAEDNSSSASMPLSPQIADVEAPNVLPIASPLSVQAPPVQPEKDA